MYVSVFQVWECRSHEQAGNPSPMWRLSRRNRTQEYTESFLAGYNTLTFPNTHTHPHPHTHTHTDANHSCAKSESICRRLRTHKQMLPLHLHASDFLLTEIMWPQTSSDSTSKTLSQEWPHDTFDTRGPTRSSKQVAPKVDGDLWGQRHHT